MTHHVVAGVSRPAWQIKKVAVRHAGRQKTARAPPVFGPLADARIRQHPFPFEEIKHT
ncbi:hypothetical protein [Streptomyces sp. NPDC002588]|jgi:hypothetical protein|uniref:hypothetical protein n=1 Tax=Streptomyces sp. NPDC002588 TaxID=3154419 RepID=UPI003321D008